MSAIDSKYHAKIAGIPVILARSARLNRHLYVREEAPSFVNKFSNGEPNYRDGSFFSHWVQLDWINGFDQEFFDDGAKFYRSESVDTSKSTKLQLERSLKNSVFDLAGDFTMECFIKLEQLPSTAGSNFTLIAKDNVSTANRSYSWSILSASDTMRVYFRDSSDNQSFFDCDTAFDSGDVGTTRHVAVAVDVSVPSATFYIDGVAQTTTDSSTSATSIKNTTTDFSVGARPTSGTYGEFFDGVFSGIAVHDGLIKTSFNYGKVTSSVTASSGSEVAKASATSTGGATIFAGCSDGKIYSWDGNTTWTSVKDTSNTSVNCVTTATFSGTSYLYFGSGDPTSNDDGTAKLHRTSDGSTFNDYTLTGGTTSAVLSVAFYDEKLFAGSGPLCRVYESDDGTTFSLSKDIDDPSNPGYPYAMAVYNNVLYVGGGSPEQYISSDTNGFLWSYDGFTWRQVFPFTFTVVKSLAVYDFVLFIGTVNKGVFVFNTASVDKLFEFPWDVSIEDMSVYDDKLMLALQASDPNNPTGNEGVYVFDRNGIRHAFSANEDGYTSLLTIGSTMMVGTDGSGYMHRVDGTKFESSGYYQSSYFEASLPTIDKLLRSITLFYDELPSGCSMEISWRSDESNSWTSLGTADNTGSTSETFNFAVTASAKKVSLKITMATTDTTETPVLRKAVVKYVISPDFKYIWKMTAVCPDNIMWLDETEPKALVDSAVTAGDSTITLDGIYGMPDPAGDTMYAQVEDSSGNVDEFTYTGVSGSQLTGVPTSGDYALGAHSAGETVRVSGKNLHQTLKALKESKKFYTYTDIDGVEYTVLFHSYQTDGWVIDQVTNPTSLEENEIPITLLEA